MTLDPTPTTLDPTPMTLDATPTIPAADPNSTSPAAAFADRPVRRPRARAGVLAGLALASSLLAGCTAGTGTETSAEPASASTTVAPPTVTAPEAPPAPAAAAAVRIARADGPLTVRAEPDDAADVVTELAATTGFGSPRALLVLDDADGWVRVQVPERPNGGSGWIDADAVELLAGPYEVTVDRAAHHLAVNDADTGAVALESPVAVGAPDAPTPTGTFAVVDRLETPDPSGAYGPFALGLGGYSETLSELGGGNGQIAIHGTNDPASIGRDVSHGCIRVPNDVVLQLAELLPLGTPVTIT